MTNRQYMACQTTSSDGARGGVSPRAFKFCRRATPTKAHAKRHRPPLSDVFHVNDARVALLVTREVVKNDGEGEGRVDVDEERGNFVERVEDEAVKIKASGLVDLGSKL